MPQWHKKPGNEAPETTVDVTASEGTTMASHNELEARSHSGKLARGVFAALLLVLPLAAAPCFARPAQQGQRPRFENNQQPHLGTWLQRHGNLSPEQQERALQSEPGFNRLPPETQQKLLDRLRQINQMPPNQRQRTVDRIEAMEHLSPQMRQQVRASVQEFHALPEDRQRLMKKAFRDLREYPPEQRAGDDELRPVSGSVHAAGAQHSGQHSCRRALPSRSTAQGWITGCNTGTREALGQSGSEIPRDDMLQVASGNHLIYERLPGGAARHSA